MTQDESHQRDVVAQIAGALWAAAIVADEEGHCRCPLYATPSAVVRAALEIYNEATKAVVAERSKPEAKEK